MSEIRVNSLGNESNTGGPVLSGITTFSGQQYFIPPTGTTAQRPSGCPPGSIRFNTDSAHLEYWNGLVWLEFEASSEELGDQNNTNSSGGTGTRALFFAGSTPSYQNIIQYVTIPTLGNAQDFGDTLAAKASNTALSNSVRGVSGGGYSPGTTDVIEFVTIASTGNAADFGNLTVGRAQLSSLASQTRGIFAGGYTTTSPATALNMIDYITISSAGNAVDFGDLYGKFFNTQACASSVRGIISGGSSPTSVNTINYLTISTTGNSQEFGDLTVIHNVAGGCSNSTRGLFGGGINPGIVSGGPTDFITIATTGNAQDFGDLTVARGYIAAASSSTRAIFGGGLGSPNPIDTIDLMEILSTGNAVDFGNLLGNVNAFAGCSNGHGGL